MMFKHVLPLAIFALLLIASAAPAVSAEIIYNETLTENRVDTLKGTSAGANDYTSNTKALRIQIENIQRFPTMNYITLEFPKNKLPSGIANEGEYNITYIIAGMPEKTGKIYVSHNRNLLNQVISTRYTIFCYDWDIGTKTGTQVLEITDARFNTKLYSSYYAANKPTFDNDIGLYLQAWGSHNNGVSAWLYCSEIYTISIVAVNTWSNRLQVTDIDGIYKIELNRVINNVPHASKIYAGNWYNHDTKNLIWMIPPEEINNITVSSIWDKTYRFPLSSGDPVVPSNAILRTGTVTMTDNNGTTITGFEVTAVNYYTGEEYTVSTETDVAVMTLPMDRTIRLRNPQTGEYEDAPVGYYKFYGNKTGYKMLNEDGIKVSVMPEEYTSYQLCIILVTPESGPLSGKHKFQIRSRTDNSILQTGTVSAKSATTGEWYNTTVSGGIASLILPYDTSNPISQYAGNYYVYATSPGYQENDYGTQIVVMPHTVSEINTILLTPIGGIPPAGNVTLRIQAFSEYGPGVANASIFIAGVLGAGSDVWNTYTTSSTGYLAVSVPGNSTYDIVASADGYYDSARRIEVFTEDPGLIEMKLYLSGPPTVEPTTQPTGWVTEPPTTHPTGGIPDEDDGSESFLVEAVRGIGLVFGVGFSTAKLIFGMLLALSIGFATAKQLRGGAAEFGLGLLGGTMLGVLIGLLPVWTVVVLLLIVGLYIGNRYIGGANNG